MSAIDATNASLNLSTYETFIIVYFVAKTYSSVISEGASALKIFLPLLVLVQCLEEPALSKSARNFLRFQESAP